MRNSWPVFFLRYTNVWYSVKNTITLTENDLAQIQEKVLDLGVEINEFRGLLVSYQAKIRRTLLLADSYSKTGDELL